MNARNGYFQQTQNCLKETWILQKIKEFKPKIYAKKEKKDFEMEISSDSDYYSGEKMNQQQDVISLASLQFFNFMKNESSVCSTSLKNRNRVR